MYYNDIMPKRKNITAKAPTKRVTTKRASTAKQDEVEPKQDSKQAHGKNQEQKQRQSIYDLMNTKTVNPFGTSDASKFETSISEMNMHDLQRLAIKVGVIPGINRTALKNKLRREFRRYTGGNLSEEAYQKQKENGPLATPGSEQAKNIQKLLGN